MVQFPPAVVVINQHIHRCEVTLIFPHISNQYKGHSAIEWPFLMKQNGNDSTKSGFKILHFAYKKVIQCWETHWEYTNAPFQFPFAKVRCGYICQT